MLLEVILVNFNESIKITPIIMIIIMTMIMCFILSWQDVGIYIAIICGKKEERII